MVVSPLSDAVSPYISVLTSDTDEFIRILPTLVSPEAVAALAPALPYSVIVKNVSKEELRGINVWFAEIREHGPPKNRQAYAALMLDPAHPTFKPGDYRFFVASNALNSAAQMSKFATRPLPGYVVDHIVPLKRGGPDDPSNMRWQSVEESEGQGSD